jgi:trigger factor
LKIEKELLEDHQIELNVEIDSDPFESAKRKSARNIAKKVKIPGFRPGKAPYNVIIRHVGENAVVEEALDILVEDIYPKILEEAEIQPFGPGSLQNIENLDPPTFKFVVPLAPEVELGDYKTLDIPYEVPPVEAEAIDAKIDELRQQQAITEKSENPATEGDRVFYQVSAKRVEVDEGQEADLIPERFNSAIIEKEGEEQNQWPFVGFSKNLLGMSIDEEKDIIYTYPEDHEDDEFKGVEAVFHVVVTNIQTVSLPELDDEFAKSASDFDTLEELRNSIIEELKTSNQQTYDSDYNEQVIETLVEQSEIKYPPQMLENEKKEMISNLEYRLSQQGITRELYLQIRGISEEEFQDEMVPVAEKRIKSGLVLAEVAKRENLEIDQEQLAAETGRTVDVITRGMSPKEAKDFQKSGNLWNLMNSIMADMMTQKSMSYIRAIAKGDPLPGIENDEAEDEESPAESSDTKQSQESDTKLEVDNDPEKAESKVADQVVEQLEESVENGEETEPSEANKTDSLSNNDAPEKD